MRTKNLFITSAALLVLASCSSDFDENSTVQNVSEQTPVSFGAYSAQSTKTRSAINGLSDLATPGFGVFAYFTDADDFGTNATPNFMYNQQVTGSEASGSYNWTYSPLKFWPNDIASDGAVDSNGATGAATGSTAGGKISFFAYAPYTENKASDGKVYTTGDTPAQVTEGITAFTNNAATGNPTVSYTIGGKLVDLLWGTAGDNNVGKVESSGTQSGKKADDDAKGNVWLDITRPEKGDKIKFNFLHALSKFGGSTVTGQENIGGIKIMLNPDEAGATDDAGKTDIERNTKVTIEYIKIDYKNTDLSDSKANTRFYKTGTLDLATGIWSDVSGSSTFSQEIQTSANVTGKLELASSLKEEANPANWAAVKTGVTLTPQSVYSENQDPVFAIPGSTPQLTIEIKYVVRTKDDHLSAGWSYAVQTIKKDITMPTFEMNKAYGLLIKLGLTSVKFEANITNWEDGGSDTYDFGSGNTTNVTIVDLPANE